MMTLNDELPIVVAVTAGTAAANGQYDHNDGKYEDKSSYNPNQNSIFVPIFLFL